MKKIRRRTLIIISALALISVVSIFANFYIPNRSPIDAELTVNVKNENHQVIFVGKNSGITKAVTASFVLNPKPIEDSQVKLESLEVKNTTLSGLMNYGFEFAYYLKASDRRDGGKIDQIKFIMSPWGEDKIPVYIPEDVVYQTDVVGKIESAISYATPFDINFIRDKKNKITANEGSILDIKEIDIRFFNDSGRICNINCLHE